MDEKQAKALLDQTANRLGEHFEAVQIMVTWQEKGQTFGLKRGVGNWYARVAMAHEMVSVDRSCDMVTTGRNDAPVSQAADHAMIPAMGNAVQEPVNAAG